MVCFQSWCDDGWLLAQCQFLAMKLKVNSLSRGDFMGGDSGQYQGVGKGGGAFMA